MFRFYYDEDVYQTNPNIHEANKFWVFKQCNLNQVIDYLKSPIKKKKMKYWGEKQLDHI